MKWSQFFSMGGYAFYVWGSYTAALLLVGGEVVLLLKRRKSLRQHANGNRRSIKNDEYETPS